MAGLEKAVALLRGAERIIILCHSFPDGDTLGAGSALCRAMRGLGKRAAVRCSDKVGPKYKYLFEGLGDDSFSPDLVVSVDVADPSLFGEPVYSQYGRKIGLSIDHHKSGTPFAEETLNNPEAAATCEVIFSLVKALGVKTDRLMANDIYTGITTDTGCFQYVNTTPKTHRIAAELMECGADTTEIDRAMFDTKSRARLELERRVLGSMRFEREGQVALIRITKQMIRESEAIEDDLDGIATIPRSIKGVKVGITLRERDDGAYKVSLRARPPADASKICEKFGGGGHKGAAGCTLNMPAEKAEREIVEETERYLDEYL
jgi:phosphoesterase RecJ-like protein